MSSIYNSRVLQGELAKLQVYFSSVVCNIHKIECVLIESIFSTILLNFLHIAIRINTLTVLGKENEIKFLV